MSSRRTVRDLMTPTVVTLDRNEDLVQADRIMTLGRIRHMPVLDEDGALVGIVSQRDLFFNALMRALGYGEYAKKKALESIPVKDCMTVNPYTIRPDAPLSEAAKLMTERKIGCLPVVDDGELIGIVTEGDFVAAFAKDAE